MGVASCASHKANASRDAHSFVRKWNFSWRVPFSGLSHKANGMEFYIPYIAPSDFVGYLLEKAPALLHGGEEDPSLQCKNLEGFWSNYRTIHPSHCLFQVANEERSCQNTIPMAFHGDEGRGLKRGNTAVIMMESSLGLPLNPKKKPDFRQCKECNCESSTANRFNLGHQDRRARDGDVPSCWQQVSNYKQHPFLTKFVLSVLPNDYYKETDVLERLMIELCENFKSLFEKGVVVAGKKYFVALTGCKGDLRWYEKIASLTRCFNKQLKEDECMCHECMAGTADLPFECTKHCPAWSQSLFHERPWDESEPPSISQIPFDDTAPEKILRRDPFHVTKQGIFRDFIGSSILLMCWLGYFHVGRGEGGNGRDVLLERAHSHFKLFCVATNRCPALRSFTPSFLSIKSWSDYGWINCKGSDVSHCLAWLQVATTAFLSDLKKPGHERTLKAIKRGAEQAQRFLHILYSHGVWLDCHCAGAMYESLHEFLVTYNLLSFLSLYSHSFTGFAKKSKFHLLAHEKFDLYTALVTGYGFALNPLIYACEGNEDVVGRLARLSRRVSPKLPSQRTLELYLIQCKSAYRRYLDVRKTHLKLKKWCWKNWSALWGWKHEVSTW